MLRVGQEGITYDMSTVVGRKCIVEIESSIFKTDDEKRSIAIILEESIKQRADRFQGMPDVGSWKNEFSLLDGLVTVTIDLGLSEEDAHSAKIKSLLLNVANNTLDYILGVYREQVRHKLIDFMWVSYDNGAD